MSEPILSESKGACRMSKRQVEPSASLKGEVGRTLRLSVPRRVMCDLLVFAKAVPGVPVQRAMNIASVVDARARLASSPNTPGWCAIFTKAYGITAERFPELRRALL